MRRLLVSTFVAVSLIGLTDGFAQGKQDKAPLVQVLIIDAQQEQIIRSWFGNPANLYGLPPGLSKKDNLSPGLQKQLVKNGKLPPGLQKRIRPLPITLEARLPRLPDGKKRVFLGGNVIIFDQRSSAIIDMLTHIF